MRGQRERSGSLFSNESIEELIAASHPLRRIRKLSVLAIVRYNPAFGEFFASECRPSMLPEKVLQAFKLHSFSCIRSAPVLQQQRLNYLVFRQFDGLNTDDPIWHPTTFTKKREGC